MAMERLTFSPFVLDVYGYCGQSALNELAVDDVEKVFKITNDYDLNTEFKLLTCLAIALALAHVHTLDNPLPATLVHYDLNPRNVAIMADGTPKLNDFNVAEFLRWDNTTKQPCGFTGRFYEPWVSCKFCSVISVSNLFLTFASILAYIFSSSSFSSGGLQKN
jgi:hypothetical protein